MQMVWWTQLPDREGQVLWMLPIQKEGGRVTPARVIISPPRLETVLLSDSAIVVLPSEALL